jgi:uncharacterized protein (TIRG00374 family)
MNKTLKNVLSYAAMLLITGFLLWFSLGNIEAPEGQSKWDFIKETWNQADKFFIFLSGLVAVLSHLVRAERWRLMLRPIGYSVSLLSGFYSVMVGYFINLAIPRGGEVSRCLNMFRLEKVPLETSAGTVVAERLIDVVFLLGFIATSFLIEYEKLIELLSGFLEKREEAQVATDAFPTMWLAIGLLLVLVLVAFVLIKSGKLAKIMPKLNEVWGNLKKGLFSVFTLEKKGLFLVYSLTIWVLYFLMAWLCMLAFPETKKLGLDAALSIFTLGSIAMAMPLPGGTGSYHVLVPAGLTLLYGLNPDKALAFTIVFHAWQTVVIIAFGLLSMIGSQFYKIKEA